ncbi:hypothetical protein Tco_0347942 [Tanacetum coccineum]
MEWVTTSPTKKKKATRNRQKRTIQSVDAPRQTSWTTEEEIALAKGWLALSENNKHGNARRQVGFWCEILKDSPKWQEITIPKFATESGGSKRQKSSSSSSFNTESGEASINLNTNVGDNEEDDVQEIQQPVAGTKQELMGKIKGRKRRDHQLLMKMHWLEYRQEQEDMRFYLQPYDHLTGDQRKAMDKIRAKIKAKYNLQY